MAYTGPGVAVAAPGSHDDDTPSEWGDGGWSTFRVARMVGATYRQLDYWCRTGLLTPDGDAAGSGSRRRWSDRDVLEAALIVALLDVGLVHDGVRVVLPWLRQIPTDDLVAGVVVLGRARSHLATSPMELWGAGGAVVLPVVVVHEAVQAAMSAELVGATSGERPRR